MQETKKRIETIVGKIFPDIVKNLKKQFGEKLAIFEHPVNDTDNGDKRYAININNRTRGEVVLTLSDGKVVDKYLSINSDYLPAAIGFSGKRSYVFTY